ncbi:hypothetical protein BVRB_5g124180 [Beta vulgaris subsp. vulgaris]|uniref:Uncharacterized protein n=1 Tax=Beta vulgaris subsp. vulgaris TaxID=3555 RepID=A0A0J8B9W0_BETVV|nr:hypothetical protein BVRB_5g124180 [Beta vulgaris subsp. vulgaris]
MLVLEKVIGYAWNGMNITDLRRSYCIGFVFPEFEG